MKAKWECVVSDNGNFGDIYTCEHMQVGPSDVERKLLVATVYSCGADDPNLALVQLAPDFAEALHALLLAYAPNVGNTISTSGRDSLQSDVRRAVDLLLAAGFDL